MLTDCLFLVMHGVPFDVAFSLAEDERRAFVVTIGELSGRGSYDWVSGRWTQGEGG